MMTSATSYGPTALSGQNAEVDQLYAALRASLIAEIEADAAATGGFTGRRKFGQRVLDAIGEVPRHEFVPKHLRSFAYRNYPLPIGEGQTISQPYIVALMTELLEPQPDQIVLEIGTGSGYQAAVLARLVRQVYSVEIVPKLADRARATFTRLGVKNVSVRTAHGGSGWPEHAPYDGIIVTAASREIPQSLVNQLKPNGRIVMPVGREDYQELVIATKDTAGTIATCDILPVRFVPLV